MPSRETVKKNILIPLHLDLMVIWLKYPVDSLISRKPEKYVPETHIKFGIHPALFPLLLHLLFHLDKMISYHFAWYFPFSCS